MRDPITDAAQDPSCLLCLTPDRGGSWWSRLRPAMPRNFADNPMTFTDSYTAQDGIGTADFTLSVDFTLLMENRQGDINIGCMQCNYYASTKGYQPSVWILKSDETKEALYPVGTSHMTGDIASVRVIKTGQNVRMIVNARDGSTVRDRTKPLPDGATVTSSSKSTNYPGNISAASIRNDTTGEIVWQAAYSDLNDTSNPWPSPVPRNFAEEPEAWRDLMAVIAAATETDWSFKIRYNLNSADGSQRIFSPGNNTGPIAVFWSSEGILYLRTIGGNGTIIQANPAGDPTGTHTVEIIAASGLYSIIYDGKTVHSVQDTPTLPRSSAEEVIQSGMNGTILYAEFSCGKAVWRYPSDAERVRLITKTNVRTDRGAFEAADETQPARVDTALDLRGKVSSYTVVVDFEAIAPNGTQSKMELAGQGAAVTGSPSICALAQSGFTGNIQLSQEINGIRQIVYKAPDNQLGRHVAVGVVDVGNSSTRLAVYYDGDLLAEDTFDGIPAGTCDPKAVNWAIFDNRNGSNTMRYGKIYSALLFDRALSAAEIAALTPKRQPLSWAGIRDIVRRGRAQRYFAVGDVLTVATPRWTIEYEVVGFDQVEPADAALTHSMTLLPVRLVTNLQFDAPEPGNPDANRAQYGCNRWDWSSIRQWLNSAAAPGEWWTVQHEYDAAPAYAATLAGFMADLPADFLNAVAPARLVTALSNAYGGGSVETVDRFWLPSRTEIFGDANNGVAEGVQMAKYIDATDADRIKYNSAGTASGWALRSSNRSNSYNIVNVSANGIMQELSWSSAWSGSIAPACIIA